MSAVSRALRIPKRERVRRYFSRYGTERRGSSARDHPKHIGPNFFSGPEGSHGPSPFRRGRRSVSHIRLDSTRLKLRYVAKGGGRYERKGTVVSHCQIIMKGKTACVHCVDRPIVWKAPPVFINPHSGSTRGGEGGSKKKGKIFGVIAGRGA